MTSKPTTAFVEELPDLISPESYAADPNGRQVRIRITVGEDGIEILGDAMRPATLEALLAHIGAVEIEQMLCG
ncbi:MAG: hypothetical protein K0R83_2878 [Caulobacter sp.]|jgi:hypothetical protein|nr:hypothetical protein [Caulobacter sp.]